MEKEKPKIKLYVAILNHGEIRREMVQSIIPMMKKTEGVDVTFENLTLTWDNPIFSNRNKIVKRFKAHEPKQDYLMMLDDDIVPLHNPAEMVFADKDIIGSPAKVRQVGRAINWVAYMLHPEEKDMYSPVDFSRVDDTTDLLKVDIVGTGCILIKRRVLEKLKAPFNIELDEDGICTHGTDFAFCRKATKAGFEVYTTVPPWRTCEHIKDGVGLSDIQGYDDSDQRDPILHKYKMHFGDWAISQKDWHFLKAVIQREGVKTVLEFGAGASSLLLSEIADVITYEENEEWAKKIKDKATKENKLEIRLWDGKQIKDELPRFDLVFVDAPVGELSGGIGREHSTRIASEISDRVILHDAGRMHELLWQKKYLRGKFKLLAKNGCHMQACHFWVRRQDAQEKQAEERASA